MLPIMQVRKKELRKIQAPLWVLMQVRTRMSVRPKDIMQTRGIIASVAVDGRVVSET
jgi:hypothetical protein